MERKILSTNPLFDKIILTPASLLGLILPYGGLKEGWSNFVFIWILICWPLPLFALWWVYGRVHPVYFDDGFVYWRKWGKKHMVPYSKLETLVYTPTRTSFICTLKYSDDNNKVKDIRFSPPSIWSSTPSATLLAEFKVLVRAKKPDFKIVQEGMFKNTEL